MHIHYKNKIRSLSRVSPFRFIYLFLVNYDVSKELAKKNEDKNDLITQRFDFEKLNCLVLVLLLSTLNMFLPIGHLLNWKVHDQSEQKRQ